jgi:hypothetical protein
MQIMIPETERVSKQETGENICNKKRLEEITK